jgi:exonuclease SbcD
MGLFRLLHISDLHLGKELHEFTLIDDQRHALGSIAELLEQGQYDALVVAGDIFDRSIPSEEAVGLWDAFISRLHLKVPQMPLIAIPGNHDSLARLGAYNRLLGRLNIHIAANPETVDQPIRITSAGGVRVNFYSVPYLPYGVYRSKTQDTSQEAAWQEAVGRIKASASWQEQIPKVLVGHLFSRGGMVSDSERTIIGQSSQISAELFEGFDYTALGHLHKPQKVTDRIWYSGSLLQYSISETGHEKYALDVSLDSIANGTLAIRQQAIGAPRRIVSIEADTLEELLNDPQGRFLIHRENFIEARFGDAARQINAINRLREKYPLIIKITDTGAPIITNNARSVDIDSPNLPVEDVFAEFHRLLHPELAADDPIPAEQMHLFRQLTMLADAQVHQ